jgi:hypothetical protein
MVASGFKQQPLGIVGTSFFNQQYPYWRAMNLFFNARDLRCTAVA